jgi:hypothetical protein
MGHTDIRTSLRYVHPVTERKRTAVESVIKSGKRGGRRKSATILPQKKQGQPCGWP